MPISNPARAWPEVGRMDRGHRGQPARPIAEHMDMLVIVEIGEIPDSGHGTHLHVKKLREGVIKQRRHRVTPKLRNREKGKKMGRPMGLEPTTPGTTNRCSNQQSYEDRTSVV